MKFLIQRVSDAEVSVSEDSIAKISMGLCVFVGIEVSDTPSSIDKLFNRLISFRIFEDESGKMNKNIQEIKGSLLFVPQFTLLADCTTGCRPSFKKAGSPQQSLTLFNYLIKQAKTTEIPIFQGEFGADMKVKLTNIGPATFFLASPETICLKKKEDNFAKKIKENRSDLNPKQQERFLREALALQHNLTLRKKKREET